MTKINERVLIENMTISQKPPEQLPGDLFDRVKWHDLQVALEDQTIEVAGRAHKIVVAGIQVVDDQGGVNKHQELGKTEIVFPLVGGGTMCISDDIITDESLRCHTLTGSFNRVDLSEVSCTLLETDAGLVLRATSQGRTHDIPGLVTRKDHWHATEVRQGGLTWFALKLIEER